MRDSLSLPLSLSKAPVVVPTVPILDARIELDSLVIIA